MAAEATHVDEVALGVRRATCVGGPRDRTTGRAGAGWAGRGFVFGPRSAGGAGGRRTGPGDRGAVTPRHHAGRPPGVRCGAARALNRGRLECGVGSESPGRPCSPHGRPTLCPAVPLGQAGGPRAGQGFTLCGRRLRAGPRGPAGSGVPGLGLLSPVVAAQAFSELPFKVTTSSRRKGLCIPAA